MMENDDFKGLSPEEKQQAENELLKLKLQAEFGMKQLDSSLDPEIENEWLNHIYSFEKQFAEKKLCKVYDFIGRPEFRNPEELAKEEISKELDRIIEIMQSNGIELGFICEYDDEVIYRFITEELFEHEMNDIRVPGMMTCFTYEEFHPNHEYDIREHSTEFIEFLISEKWPSFMNGILLSKTVSYNDKEYDQGTFPGIIEAFQAEHPKMELMNWEIRSVAFDLETGTGELGGGGIKFKSAGSAAFFEGNALLELKLEHDYWSISKVVVPGFSNGG